MSRPEAPPRWSDEEAGPASLGALFAAARRDGASDDELTALSKRLGALLDAPPVAPVAQKAIPLYKFGASALILGALISGAFYLHARATPHPGTLAAAQTTRQAAHDLAPSSAPSRGTAEPVAVVAPLAPAEVTVAPPKKPLAVVGAPPNAVSPAQAEATLLEHARAALTSDPTKALALAQEHAARFPHGLLSQEREVIAISALRRLGRSPEAEQRAARFDKAYPGSAHQQTVDSTTPR